MYGVAFHMGECLITGQGLTPEVEDWRVWNLHTLVVGNVYRFSRILTPEEGLAFWREHGQG